MVAVLPDQLDPLRLLELLFGYDEVSAGLPEDGTGGLKTRRMGFAQNDHLVIAPSWARLQGESWRAEMWVLNEGAAVYCNYCVKRLFLATY